MAPARTRRDAHVLANALLDHVAGPERARALEQLGGLRGAVDAKQLAAAMRAARLDEAEARRVGVAAAAGVDVALAARQAGVGSTERALRQADRLLPREHATGVFEIRALTQGEARVAYAAPGAVDPLLCAARAGLLAGLPRSFGGRLARVEEIECAQRGAEACTYRVRWRRGIADRPLLHTLTIGALAGAVLWLVGWALAVYSPSGSVTLFAVLGAAGAGRLFEATRALRIGHQAGLVLELEQQIAERMDDLAKVDASAERRELSQATGDRVDQRAAAHEHALERELASFGRELASLRARVSTSDASLVNEFEAVGDRFERLRAEAAGLIGDSGGESTRHRREDLGALLAHCVERVPGGDGGAAEIRLDLPADLPFVHCDAVRIERAVDQLLRSARELSGVPGAVEVTAVALPGGVEVSVRGDRVGADPDGLEQTFDPFLGGGDAQPIEGGGLHLAAEVVAEHGGSLQLQADDGAGTRASFVLPLATAD